MKWLVFSKNRAYQLDAFLNTAKYNAKIEPADISVLYKYDSIYENQLNDLISSHKQVNFIKEEKFREQVIDWCRNTEDLVSFATDDALFTRDLQEKKISEVMKHDEVLTFSLRMGLHLDFCYPINSKQKIPNGNIQNEMFFWQWPGCDGDWSYPLSVDGHVFRKEDAVEILKNIDFNNPNVLEANMQQFCHIVSNRIIACHVNSRYFNSPVNIVQTFFDNRHGNVTSQEFARFYDEGYRFDAKDVLNFFNKSAHEEFNILKNVGF